MAVYLVSLITLLFIAFAAYYLVRVPGGPACPRCGRLTESGDAPTHNLKFLSKFRSEEASCPSCGWNGRLRRAPRPVLARVFARPGRRS